MKELPAFPSVVRPVEEGMNLRDYFAGQVIAGIAAHRHFPLDEGAVERAYEIADMMIKQRKNEQQNNS